MSLSSTRGLVRVSKNPDCDLQAAMALERVREPEFYRRVTGTEFAGEYGERVSARRRGAKFEAALHQNHAAGLRRALGPVFGHDPETMAVRNFADEVPGPPTTMRAVRLARTRRILDDLAAGRQVPDLVIQPQLALPTGTDAGQMEYVSPDFMVRDPLVGIYVPGEEKSFIVRDNVADPADLDLTRRQAAAQILALRAETRLVGLADRVSNRAVFVMATPFGMRPAPPVVEELDAAVREIERAIATFARVRKDWRPSGRPAMCRSNSWSTSSQRTTRRSATAPASSPTSAHGNSRIPPQFWATTQPTSSAGRLGCIGSPTC